MARAGNLKEWIRALSSGSLAEIQRMKEKGWDLHAKIERVESGSFPIHLVVLSKNALALQFLLDHRVDMNVRDKLFKRTPLLYAIETNAIEVHKYSQNSH